MIAGATNPTVAHEGLLDRLERLGPVRFLLVLYLVRWLVLAPLLLLASQAAAAPHSAGIWTSMQQAPDLLLFVILVLRSPLIETLLECTVPYLLWRWLTPTTTPRSRSRRAVRRPRTRVRAWGFIAASAAIMVLMHPLELQTSLATAITGCFLAYAYMHFARAGQLAAFAGAAVFHAAINLLGFVILALT